MSLSHRQVSVSGYEAKKEWSTVQNVESYLSIANDNPHLGEAEAFLNIFLLVLGTADGRLMKL